MKEKKKTITTNNKKTLSEKELNELINFNMETDFLFEEKQEYNKKINFVKSKQEEKDELDESYITFKPNLKILPHIEILTFDKINKNDEFDINIKKIW